MRVSERGHTGSLWTGSGLDDCSSAFCDSALNACPSRMDFIWVQQPLSSSSSISSSAEDFHSFWIKSENDVGVMNGKASEQKGRW